MCSAGRSPRGSDVALLAEGVDRNPFTRFSEIAKEVALLAEGVDRNIYRLTPQGKVIMSPSSRRAWIEIAGDRRRGGLPGGRPPRGGRG